jgi:hypothetical protein
VILAFEFDPNQYLIDNAGSARSSSREEAVRFAHAVNAIGTTADVMLAAMVRESTLRLRADGNDEVGGCIWLLTDEIARRILIEATT